MPSEPYPARIDDELDLAFEGTDDDTTAVTLNGLDLVYITVNEGGTYGRTVTVTPVDVGHGLVLHHKSATFPLANYTELAHLDEEP